MIVKAQHTFKPVALLLLFSCNPQQENSPLQFAPKVVKAQGYVVPKDKRVEPKVVPAGKPRVVRAGKPKVVLTNTNVHPAGIPKVVMAGIPRVCTPGQDRFPLPKIVPAIDSPFIAGIPEVVIAKEAHIKDQNPYNFSSFGKLQGLKNNFIHCLLEDKCGNLWFGTNGGGVCKYDGKSFTHFTEKEGLNGNFVTSILEDKSGNLWFGIWSGGVCKYDGKSFTRFTEKEGLSNNDIWCILEDKSGNLWFGTSSGVCKYDASVDTGKSFTHFTEKEGLSSKKVMSILEDKSGNLWFGTEGDGVSKYVPSMGGQAGSFIHYTEKEGLSSNKVTSIIEDKSGNLWFGTSGGGVSKYVPSMGGQAGSFIHYTEKEGLTINYVTSVLEDKSGNLWFGTWSGGVCKYDASVDTGKSFTRFTENEGLSGNYVTSILEDKSGNIWVGSAGGGLCKYGGNSFVHFTEKEGLSNNTVMSILEDKSGNLWFGTSGGGVCKYENAKDGQAARFSHFSLKEGLSGVAVWTMLEDKNGNLWFGTNAGASKYEPPKDGQAAKFTHYTEKEGLGSNDVKSILQDKSGNLWFGTNNGGVSKFDGKNFTKFTTQEGLSLGGVMSIQEDQNGNLWFCGYGGGVTKYEPPNEGQEARFTHFSKKEGIIHNDVRIIQADKNGNLWFGTRGGVSMYNVSGVAASNDAGESFTHFTEKEGLSNNIVQSILLDKKGNLWFGTGFGLSKFEKEKLDALTGHSEVIVARSANTKTKEQKSGVTKSTTYESASGLSDPYSFFKTYTYEDGFSGMGVLPGPTICEAKDGTIWIASDDRLTAFHPLEENPDTIAPNIQLTGLALFNEPIAWQNLISHSRVDSRSPGPTLFRSSPEETKKDTSFVLGNGVRVHDFYFDGVSRWYGVPEHLSLAYNNNNLTFQFVGITMQAPKKVKYQYKLEGLDQNWSILTDHSEVTYSNLPHGRFTFKVKAMNGSGHWSKELDYSFAIRPPWWLTWWAYGIYSLLFAAIVWLIYRNQKQRILRSEREKTQERELEQAKEIEKAYVDLKATQAQLIQSEKMASLGELTAGIAHEIQNPLNFVNNFSEVSNELIVEMNNELNKGAIDEAKTIALDIQQNLGKINHHGKRADAIVKGMLQHSRISTGQKEPTDINALADEYLRLSYHGLRAKDKTFNATLQTDFDETIGKINIIPQDIGRVLLNLYNNAFYAVNEKQKQLPSGYEPIVSVSTKKVNDIIQIHVRDNGNGIPQNVIDKIFQPFFTTKPTGQGSGLGLSLSYDIVKAHGGDIKVICNHRPSGSSISVISNYNEPGIITVNSFNSPQSNTQSGPMGGPVNVSSNYPAPGDPRVEQEDGMRTEFIVNLPI